MKSIVRLGVCVAILGGGVAFAQGEEQFEPQPLPEEPYTKTETTEVTTTEEVAFEEKDVSDLWVLIGGGVEGYTGSLAPAVNPGFAWAATVGFRPWPILGFEGQYSGATGDIDLGRGETEGGVTNGADIVRNGGQVAAVVDFSSAQMTPYLLAGIGVENYNVRGGFDLGFDDDTNGYVPAGLGVRWQLAKTVSADLRGSYNFSFDQDFAPVDSNGLGDNRYQALLQIGGIF